MDTAAASPSAWTKRRLEIFIASLPGSLEARGAPRPPHAVLLIDGISKGRDIERYRGPFDRPQKRYEAEMPIWRFCASGTTKPRSVIVDPGVLACAGFWFTYCGTFRFN